VILNREDFSLTRCASPEKLDDPTIIRCLKTMKKMQKAIAVTVTNLDMPELGSSAIVEFRRLNTVAYDMGLRDLK
jgi:hypothetical protein